MKNKAVVLIFVIQNLRKDKQFKELWIEKKEELKGKCDESPPITNF